VVGRQSAEVNGSSNIESAEHSVAAAAADDDDDDSGGKPARESRDEEAVTSSSPPARVLELSDIHRDSDLLLSARRTSVDYFQKVRGGVRHK